MTRSWLFARPSTHRFLPPECGLGGEEHGSLSAPADGVHFAGGGVESDEFVSIGTGSPSFALDDGHGGQKEAPILLVGKGCEVCGGDDHNDQVLLCDGAKCAYNEKHRQKPPKEYHM